MRACSKAHDSDLCYAPCTCLCCLAAAAGATACWWRLLGCAAVGRQQQLPLWGPACDFLSIRAAGAPVTVLLLVMQVGWEGAGTRHQRLQPSVTYQLTATHWCDGLTGTIQRRNLTIYVVARAG